MNGYDRLMKSAPSYLSELFRIISGALRLDLPKVRNYTAFLADKLESDGDVSAAERLRTLLVETEHQLHPATLSTSLIPVDPETRFPLAERMESSRLPTVPPVLTEEQHDTITEFLIVAKSYAQLHMETLDVALTLLAFGPPGCGKSHLAGYIAHELGLPLVVVRLDGLISSYLGSTSKNIRTVFEYAASTPSVLFLDEFDAIAKLRDDRQELGELKRVVNSFVQNLDRLGSHSVVVAATNHPQLLDPAVWRRFTYRIELPYPTAPVRERLWHSFLTEVGAFDRVEISLLTDLSEGFSGADIREVSLRLRRNAVTQHREPSLRDAFLTLMRLSGGHGEERRFLKALGEPEAIARQLKQRNPHLYSAAHIAQVLGVSKATAYRWSTMGDRRNGKAKRTAKH
jgi:ATPase family associated with various cellular activities (AAA)